MYSFVLNSLNSLVLILQSSFWHLVELFPVLALAPPTGSSAHIYEDSQFFTCAETVIQSLDLALLPNDAVTHSVCTVGAVIFIYVKNWRNVAGWVYSEPKLNNCND